MKTLKELRAERAAKAARGKTALTEFNTLGAKTDRTEADEAQLATLGADLDTLEAEVTALDGQIAAEEAKSRRGALFTAPSRAALGAGRTVGEPDPVRTAGFRSLGEFAGAVVRSTMGHHDDRLAGGANGELGATAATGSFNANGGGAGEGFLVPPEYSQQVYDIAFEATDLLGMSQPEPTSSNAVFKPKDETTPWGAVGVQAAWRSEGSQMIASKAVVSGELLALHELYAFCAASQEVLSDAPMLGDRLTRQAGNAISWKASDSIMWGDGAGKPLGFMKAPALIAIAKDANQAAKTLSVSNLANMLAAVLRVGGQPMWMINPDVIPQLVALTIPGTTIPAYLPNNQPLKDNPYEGALLGYPVLFTEHCQTLGTVGDVVCANLKGGYYSVTKGGGVDMATSIHLYFDQNLTAFRWTFRLTGQPFLSKPVQPANGGRTKSHFVALATRG